jgi:hypothetical protein
MHIRLAIAFACLVCTHAIGQTQPAADDELARLFKSLGHYIVEDRKVQNELTETPLPMLDWGLVQPGFVAYLNKTTRHPVPLGEKHDLTDPAEIEAIPVAVPSGIRIGVQPAIRGGTFSEELFKPQFPWERDCEVHTLLYDEADKRYKLWYRMKDLYAYAESSDFKTWDRPLHRYRQFESHERTNLLSVIGATDGSAYGDLRSLDEARIGNSGAFFIDPSAPPEQRYKCTFLGHVKPTTVEYARQNGLPLSAMTDPPSTVLFGAVSADGVGWRMLPRPIMLHDADTLTVTRYDPLLKRYVMYTRLYELGRRSVGLSETTDFSRWPLPTNVLSAGPEHHPSVDFYASAFTYYPARPEIRLMMCLAYDRAVDRSDVRLATSRDGHAFHFTPGGPVVAPARLQDPASEFLSAFPSLVRVPDGRLLVFCEGSRVPHKFPRHRFGGSRQFAAFWPEDRLAAIEAPEQGEFTTARLVLRGKRLLLNLESARTGGIDVELRDEQFRPVQGRTFADADRIWGDRTHAAVTWRGNADLNDLSGRSLYLRFRLRAAKLYSVFAGS